MKTSVLANVNVKHRNGRRMQENEEQLSYILQFRPRQNKGISGSI